MDNKAKKRPSRQKRNSGKKNVSTVIGASGKAIKSKGAAKHRLQHVAWGGVELEDLNPLLQRQFVVGQQIMLARVLLKKGCVVPRHSHRNEQSTYILEGALKFDIDGRELILRAGEVLLIPPNMPHEAMALEDTVDLDIFTPPRADWIKKTDQYLRGQK